MTMNTKQQRGETVTIDKEEYEALLHTAQVTSEYLEGKVESFDSKNKLIAHLKNL